LEDAKLKEIRQLIWDNKTSDFSEDSQGTLRLGRWICVPNLKPIKEAETMYRDTDEVESFGAESPVIADRLQALLEHLGITTAPWYRIKEVPRSGRMEFKAVAEIFFGSRVLCRHKGPAFRTSRSDVVADAAWQAITSWVHSNKSRLQNSVHYLLPYRKKEQFKAYW
jgi:hypothetical protein